MRVTVLGLGRMGSAFASRALQKGHRVTAWNRSPGRAEELVARGAVEASTPAEAVAQAEVALVVVADDAAVEETCLGQHGALCSLAADAVLANVSTVAPETVRRLAEAGPAGRVLGTPVMGSPAAIARGEGRFFVGGPDDAVARVDPLLRDLGADYVHCGPIETAAVMKVLSNLLLITGVAALAEAVATARSQGIGDDLLRTVLAESTVVSPATRLRLDALLDGDHPGWFPPELARKDLRLAVGVAEQAGIPVRVGPVTDELLTKVIDTGRRWADFAAIIEALTPQQNGY
jgi:3-hydroxyisobutyrate dehydrogenase-like beta-hydroxyacid dehydrogenase